MAKDIAIVLACGSISSAVACALAAQKYRLVMLHAETSPTPPARERASYDLQVGHFKPFREHTVAMPWLAGMQGHHRSGEMRSPADPAGKLVDLLPLAGVASRFAAHYQAMAVYAGLRLGPDEKALARATEFVQVWNELLQMPLSLGELEFHTPLVELEPWQVIDLGIQVNAPLDKTWSCDFDNPDPCGTCVGCRARDAAFAQAARPDPLKSVKR